MEKFIEKIKDNFNAGMNVIRNNPWKTFLFLILIGLSFGLKVSELNTGLQHEFPGSDPYSSAQNALDVLDGKAAVNNFANPLPSLYLIFVYSIFGKSLWFAKFIQVLASFIIPYFLYYFTKKYFGDVAGYIAAVLALIHPSIIFYSGHIWGEFWIIFLFSAMLYLFVRIQVDKKYSWWNFFLIGAFTGIASLGKIWMGLIGALLTVVLLLNFYEKKKIGFFIKKSVSLGSFALLGVLLFLVPWIIYTSINSGYFVFINTNSQINLYIGNYPEGEIAFTSKSYSYDYTHQTNISAGNCGFLLTNSTGKKYDEYLRKCTGKYACNYILDNPGRFAAKMTKFTFTYWLFPNLEFYQRYIKTPKLLLFSLWSFWVLGLVGLLVSLTKYKGFIPFYLMMLVVWFFSGMAFYLARYKVGLAPISIFFAAGGLYTLGHFLWGKDNKKKK